MKFSDLGDNGPNFIREMDSQGYTGSRDSAEADVGKKEYYGKLANPKDVVDQGADILNKAYNDKEQDVDEAEEDAFMSKLGGLKSWQVVIMNNYYRGKYSDYSGRYYYVLASSPEEAKQVVLDNADAILQDLLSMKGQNGKKILPRGSAVRITPDRIGKIEDGTVAGRMSTAGYKKMYSPQGVMMVKLSGGEVVDVQDQGMSESANGNPGQRLIQLFRAIYKNGGDDSIDYLIHNSPIFADYYDQYEGDLESIAAEVDAAELQVMVSELEEVAENEGLTEASLAQMRDYFNQADTDSVRVDRNYDAPSKKQNPVGIPPEIQALVNKMYHAGKISPQEFETLRKFQRQTKINVGIREADKNPYAIGMAQAMKSTGDKPPLKKSTINKAHEIARAIKKDQ